MASVSLGPRLAAITRPLRGATSRHSQRWICSACLQRLQRPPQSKHRGSRSLATAAAERPHTLFPDPPPRNAGIAKTSIAGGNAQVDDSAPLDQRRRESDGTRETQATPSHTTITEEQAQQSQPTVGPARGSLASADPATPSEKPVRKSKLRPRKAAMTLTSGAVEQLRGLLSQPDPKLIRVGVKNKGCSGLAYHLEYVDKAGTFDEAVEQDGVKVLIDSKALFSIIGSEMDWVEDKLSARFVFKNPNITEQCGCGESFSIS